MAISKQTNATRSISQNSSALEAAMHKISSVEVPQGKSIALAYSGGLDTSVSASIFLNSRLSEHLRSPMLFTHMRAAADRSPLPSSHSTSDSQGHELHKSTQKPHPESARHRLKGLGTSHRGLLFAGSRVPSGAW